MVKGKARVRLSFDAWKDGGVAPAVLEVPVHVPEAVESPRLRRTVRGLPETTPAGVSFAPDGKTVALVPSDRGEVQLWDVDKRQEVRRLAGEPGKVQDTAFAPDGKLVAVAYADSEGKEWTGGVVVWDVATGQKRAVLRHSSPRVSYELDFSADGRFLVVREVVVDTTKPRGAKVTLSVWNVAGGKVALDLVDNRTTAAAFAPDVPVLARAVYRIKDNRLDGVEVLRHDLATGRELPPLATPDRQATLNKLAFAPDGRTLAGADYHGALILWDVVSGKVRQARHEASRRVLALAWSPDGKIVAAALGDPSGRSQEPGWIVLWEAVSVKPLETLTGHTDEVLGVAFAPDGRTLLSVGRDRTLRTWDVGERTARSR